VGGGRPVVTVMRFVAAKIDVGTQYWKTCHLEIKLGDSEACELWIDCRVDAKQFHGAGDPSRLEEIINHFIRWAKDRPDWLALPDDSSLT